MCSFHHLLIGLPRVPSVQCAQLHIYLPSHPPSSIPAIRLAFVVLEYRTNIHARLAITVHHLVPSDIAPL